MEAGLHSPQPDIDKDTSYRSISLLSVIAKTRDKSLLPYITANATRVHNTTVTALQTSNNRTP